MARTLIAMIFAALVGASMSNPDLACTVAKKASEIAVENASLAYSKASSKYRKMHSANHCKSESAGKSSDIIEGYKIPEPKICRERIDACDFVYSSELAKQIFHEGVTQIMSDIPYDSSIHSRNENMHRLKEAFFGSYFGLVDAERIGGNVWGDYVMDEARAVRIRDHAMSCHGRKQRMADDPCLAKIDTSAKTSSVQTNRKWYYRQEQRQGRPTWNDVAVSWLGAKPASEYRAVSPGERAIGRNWW